jgi:hypothetical protein
MELYDLLSQKDFEALTPAEREAVLAQTTQAAYEAERQLIVASQALWAQEMAELQPQTPTAALQGLRAKRTAATASNTTNVFPLWKHAVQFSIPLWQVAAALLLLLGAQYFWTAKSIVPPLATTASATDTVYIDRYHTKTVQLPADTLIKLVYRTIVDTVSTVAEPILVDLAEGGSAAPLSDSLAYYAERGAVDIWDWYQKEGGASLNQDSFLQAMTRQVAEQVGIGRAAW